MIEIEGTVVDDFPFDAYKCTSETRSDFMFWYLNRMVDSSGNNYINYRRKNTDTSSHWVLICLRRIVIYDKLEICETMW